MLSTSSNEGASEASRIEDAAISLLEDIAFNRAAAFEVPWRFFRGQKDHDAKVTEVLDQADRLIAELGSMWQQMVEGLETQGKSEKDARALLQLMARSTNLSTLGPDEQGRIADEMVSSLAVEFQGPVREAFIRFQTHPRLLPLLMNGRGEAFVEGAFRQRLEVSRQAFATHQQRLAKEEEASRLRLEAEKERLADEAAARKKKLAEEEAARKKKLAKKEAALEKKLADEAAAWKKKLAEEEAAWKKKLADEEAARRNEAFAPVKALLQAAATSVLPFTTPFLDGVFERLRDQRVLSEPCELTTASIIKLARSRALQDAVLTTVDALQSEQLQVWKELPLQLYVPDLERTSASASAQARDCFITTLASGFTEGANSRLHNDRCANLFLGARGTGKSTVLRSLALSTAVLSRGLPESKRTVSKSFGKAPNVTVVYIAKPFKYPTAEETHLQGRSMLGLCMRAACEMQGTVVPTERLPDLGDWYDAVRTSSSLRSFMGGRLLVVVDELNDFYIEQPEYTRWMCSQMEDTGGGFYALSGSSHRLPTMMFHPAELHNDKTYLLRDLFKGVLPLNSSKIETTPPLLPFQTAGDVLDYLEFLGEGEIHPDLLPAYREMHSEGRSNKALQKLIAKVIRVGSTHRGVTRRAYEKHRTIAATADAEKAAAGKTDVEESASVKSKKSAKVKSKRGAGQRRAAVSLPLRNLYQRVQSTMSWEVLEALAEMGEAFLENQGVELSSLEELTREVESRTINRLAAAIADGRFHEWMTEFKVADFSVSASSSDSSSSKSGRASPGSKALLSHLRALADDGQLLMQDTVMTADAAGVSVNNWTMAALCELLALTPVLSKVEINALLNPQKVNALLSEALLAESVMLYGVGKFLGLCKPLVASDVVGDIAVEQHKPSITRRLSSPKPLTVWKTRQVPVAPTATERPSEPAGHAAEADAAVTVAPASKAAGEKEPEMITEKFMNPDALIPEAGKLFRSSMDFGGEDVFGVFKDATVPGRVHLVGLQLKLNVEKGKGVETLGQVAQGAVERFHAGQTAERAKNSKTWVKVAVESVDCEVREVVIWCVIASSKRLTKGQEAGVLEEIRKGQAKMLGIDRTEEGLSVKYNWCVADHAMMAQVWSPRIRSWARLGRYQQYLTVEEADALAEASKRPSKARPRARGSVRKEGSSE